jgi:hypothetical protein
VIFLRLIPIMLASLILGAHFLRDGHMVLVLICVLLPFLLVIRRRWVLQLLQGYALVGALIWAQSTYGLVQTRMAEGASWTRMLLILGGVTVFTLWAGYLLRSDSVRKHYPSGVGEPGSEEGAAPEEPEA